MIGPVPGSVVGARGRPVRFAISISFASPNFFNPMSYDSTNDSDRPSRPSPSDDKQEENKKPFVKPELRRETDLIDGTGTTVSFN